MESVVIVDSQFWNGKKVFVTGHTGFKGSWLSLWLQQMGAKVTGYALKPPTIPNLFDLAGVSESMQSLIGDVRDLSELSKAMTAAVPDIVLHLAAQPLVRQSYKIPVDTYAINVMGTVHVLEAIRTTPSVKAAVMVTTDKCYENKEWEWGYRENEPMGGYDPYSNSKGCAELVISAYRRSFFNTTDSANIASARAGNVIGGGDFAEDRLIPDIVRAVQGQTKLQIRHPEATRPWQFVLESLSGYLLLAERLYGMDGKRFAEGWNFGPNLADTWPVRKLVAEISANWKNLEIPVFYDETGGVHEANWLALDISKARNKLGWCPSLSLKEAISMTSTWYDSHWSKGNMREITIQQINSFQKHCTMNSVAPEKSIGPCNV